MGRTARAASGLAIATSMLLVLPVMVAAQGTTSMDDQRPTIGATIRPSILTVPAAETSTSTRVGNAGSVPVSISAAANLPGTRVEAAGWLVTVDTDILEAGDWATVTLASDGASLSDISLDIFMAPETSPGGVEAIVLRFPIAVDVEAATPQTTGQAWVESIWRGLLSPWLATMFRTP